MKESTKSILKYALSFGVMGVLLYFSFRGISWTDFWTSLKSCRWEWILLSMCFGLLAFVIRGGRWRMQLLPIDPKTSFRTTYDAVTIGLLFNLALPRAGELIKCLYISKHSSRDEKGERRTTYDKAVGTMVMDRGWDLISAALIVLVMVVLLRTRQGSYLYESLKSGMVAHKGLLLPVLALFVAALAFCVLVWVFRKKGGIFGRIWKFLMGMKDGVLSCFHMKKSWLFFIYTLLIWACYWMMMYTVILALRDIPEIAHLGATDALFLMLVGTVSMTVPVPGGFGAYHSFLLATLTSVYGIPPSIGITLAVLSHESSALTQLIFGLVSYVTDSFRKD